MKQSIKLTVQEMYALNNESHDAFLAALDKSLNPRSPDMLYDKFNSLGPRAESVVLDIGCRDAAQACELSERFGCQVVGLDLVSVNIQDAGKRITEKGLSQPVQVIQGDIQQLPFRDSIFDFIWCRDVLGHMPDLHQAFKSCTRTLKPNGKMLIFEMFATEMLTGEEADQLFSHLATVPENMSQPYFEEAFTSAGLSLVDSDWLSTEWREYGEETGSKITSKQLLRIARMRRNREKLITEFGEKRYLCELANCHWGVFQILGKLSPAVYTLSK